MAANPLLSIHLSQAIAILMNPQIMSNLQHNLPSLFVPSPTHPSLPFTQSFTLDKPQRPRSNSSRPCRRSFTPPNMEWKPAGLLRDVVKLKKFEVQLMEKTLTQRPDHPVNMRRSFFAQKPTHRFSQALHRRDNTLSIVLAMKRFQPVHGEKPTLISPLEQIGLEARRFESYGVDAALIYTDSMQYGIETAELGQVTRELRSSSKDFGMPVARQDIIVDPIQIAEAAEAGACAVNIVAAAALPELLDLLNAATAMGLEAMVECHTSLEVEFAMECGATILYLSNFDRTRNVEVEGRALQLANGLPPWITRLGGGGVVTAGDCWKYLDGGFHGVVLGRTLLRTSRPEGFMQEIRSQKYMGEDVFARGLGNPFGEGMDRNT